MTGAVPRSEGTERIGRREVVAVLLVFALALGLRVRDLGASFDRQVEGFQGAFFATAAVNYERLGAGALGGYPVVNIDLDRDTPETWYAYPNHPPTVPLLAWASVQVLGPEGWEEAWRESRAPVGIESALRAPFFALHVLGLLVFWWVLRIASGPRAALIGLALLAVLPVSALFATLVNYENPSLLPVLLAYGFFVRYVTGAGRRRRIALAALGASFFVGCCITFAPLFFVPPLVLHRLLARKVREALVVGGVGTVACLLPVVVHFFGANAALETVGIDPWAINGRLADMLGPLLSGSVPLTSWLSIQGGAIVRLFSWPIAVAAGLGLGLGIVRGLRGGVRRDEGRRPRVDIGWPLFLGGALVQFFYYKHTSDVPGQDLFLLNLSPGACAMAATLLASLRVPLGDKLRCGVVTATLLLAIGIFAVVELESLRFAWRHQRHLDAPRFEAGAVIPMPSTSGPELAQLLPPGSASLYPASLGLNGAYFFYAWRTMYPVSGMEDIEQSARFFARFGLGDAPRFLVLPNRPTGEARTQAEYLWSLFSEYAPDVAALPPHAQTDHWTAWILNP